jgi:hypothetical protein
LGINASTEQFPVIGGPAVGEFIANGPILISTAMKESQHATPTKPSVTLVNKKRPLEQSSQVSGNSKKKRVNISRSSSTIDSSTLWDSDDTDTDTETNNLIKKHMVSFVQAPNTPSPARTKLPLTHRNTLSVSCNCTIVILLVLTFIFIIGYEHIKGRTIGSKD